ncbi:MAG: VOC family protein [Usitatibacter sp.]
MGSDPVIHLDHLVIAARTLEEGVSWVEARVGVPMGAGGKHALMGTHNRLLSLGPGRFLEVIAVDPDAPAPSRSRWFDLDAPGMRERLEKGPAFIHWVVRSGDIVRTVAATASGKPDILKLSRGEFRWRIAVPASGSLARSGTSPTVIQWEGPHPADVLADSGCRLEMIVLRHPEAPATLHSLRLAGLGAQEPVRAHHDGLGLEARIRTPRGIAELRE